MSDEIAHDGSGVNDSTKTIVGPRVFVSHSNRDAGLAMQIVGSLEAAEVKCWIAPRDILLGAEFNAAIMEGIQESKALVLVLTRHSAESDPVLREVERAKNRRIPVIPVRVEHTTVSKALEYLISTSQWIDAFPPPIERHLPSIVSGVKRALNLAQEQPAFDPDAPPQYVGPYHLLEKLGEGGMGTVYKAEQRSPMKQMVAVKLIRAGFSTKEVLARFESERQALAMMNHPHIAHVLAAGADNRGRPYFVMEYVPGKPITAFADDNKLSITQRLVLFRQVCEAIGHAHAKAIIHRDIKSSNVLAYMDGENPVAKVIDFGLAKALTGDKLTDRTFNTHLGQIIGTYESMSPEQADGSADIDTRTDVYSLGVLLYELLTGVKPFEHGTFAKAADVEIRRIIKEVEPPRPSTRLSSLKEDGAKIAAARRAQLDALAKQLRSELEWIPLMAMRKERDRRYSSPLALADDVHRYLDGKPLVAGPDSAGYRVGKFVRRNRGAIAAAVALLLVLIAGTVGTTVGFIREAKQRRAAEGAYREADRQRDLAQRYAAGQETLKQEAVNREQSAKRSMEFLRQALFDLDTYTAGNQPPDLDKVFQSAESRLATLRGDNLALAVALQALGRVAADRQRYDYGIKWLRQAAELWHDFARSQDVSLDPGATFREEAKTRNWLGWALSESASQSPDAATRRAQAISAAHDAYLIAREHFGVQDDDTIAYWADWARVRMLAGDLTGAIQEFIDCMAAVSGKDPKTFIASLQATVKEVAQLSAAGRESEARRAVRKFLEPYLAISHPRLRGRIPWSAAQAAAAVCDYTTIFRLLLSPDLSLSNDDLRRVALVVAHTAEDLSPEINPQSQHPDHQKIHDAVLRLERPVNAAR